MTTFGARFAAALEARGPLCAGIDPHSGLLAEWGLPDDVSGLERFALTAVEGLAPHVAVVKPQSAFYERFGSRGVAVLERVIAESRAAGALVLLDVKRGDIGSTTPGLRRRLPRPGLAAGGRRDHGVAVPRLRLARPDGRHRPQARRRAVRARADLQQGGAGGAARRAPRTASTVAGRMLDHLRAAQRRRRAARLLRRGHRRDDRRRAELDFDFNGPILAPGFGAQGGTVADIRRIFGSAVAAVTPSSSRELLRRGPSVEAMRDEALRLNDELAGSG